MSAIKSFNHYVFERDAQEQHLNRARSRWRLESEATMTVIDRIMIYTNQLVSSKHIERLHSAKLATN